MHRSALSGIVNEDRFEGKLTLPIRIAVAAPIYPRHGLLLKSHPHTVSRPWYLLSEETRPIIVKSGYYRTTLEIPEMRVPGVSSPPVDDAMYMASAKMRPSRPQSQATVGEKRRSLDFISHSLSQYPAVHTRRHPHELPHSRMLYTRCTHANACARACMSGPLSQMHTI